MNNSRPPFFWGVIAASAAMVFVYVCVAVILVRYGGLAADFGWDASRRDDVWQVSRIRPGGPADGRLQADDVVLAAQRQRSCGERSGPFFDVSGYEVGARFVRVQPESPSHTSFRFVAAMPVLDVSLTPAVQYQSRASCRHDLAAGHQPLVFSRRDIRWAITAARRAAAPACAREPAVGGDAHCDRASAVESVSRRQRDVSPAADRERLSVSLPARLRLLFSSRGRIPAAAIVVRPRARAVGRWHRGGGDADDRVRHRHTRISRRDRVCGASRHVSS